MVNAGATRENELLNESLARPNERPLEDVPGPGPGPGDENKLALNSSGVVFLCSAIPAARDCTHAQHV